MDETGTRDDAQPTRRRGRPALLAASAAVFVVLGVSLALRPGRAVLVQLAVATGPDSVRLVAIEHAGKLGIHGLPAILSALEGREPGDAISRAAFDAALAITAEDPDGALPALSEGIEALPTEQRDFITSVAIATVERRGYLAEAPVAPAMSAEGLAGARRIILAAIHDPGCRPADAAKLIDDLYLTGPDNIAPVVVELLKSPEPEIRVSAVGVISRLIQAGCFRERHGIDPPGTSTLLERHPALADVLLRDRVRTWAELKSYGVGDGLSCGRHASAAAVRLLDAVLDTAEFATPQFESDHWTLGIRERPPDVCIAAASRDERPREVIVADAWALALPALLTALESPHPELVAAALRGLARLASVGVRAFGLEHLEAHGNGGEGGSLPCLHDCLPEPIAARLMHARSGIVAFLTDTRVEVRRAAAAALHDHVIEDERWDLIPSAALPVMLEAATGGEEVPIWSPTPRPRSLLPASAGLVTAFDQPVAPNRFVLVLVANADQLEPHLDRLVEVALEPDADGSWRAAEIAHAVDTHDAVLLPAIRAALRSERDDERGPALDALRTIVDVVTPRLPEPSELVDGSVDRSAEPLPTCPGASPDRWLALAKLLDDTIEPLEDDDWLREELTHLRRRVRAALERD